MKYHTVQKLEQSKRDAYETGVPQDLLDAAARHDRSLSDIFGVASARKAIDAFRDMRDTRIVFSSLVLATERGDITPEYPAFLAQHFIRSPEATEKKNLRDVFPALRYGELQDVKASLEKSGVTFDGFKIKKFSPKAA